MPKTMTVEGVKYAVTEQPGFDHSIGGYRAFVTTPEGDKAIVKIGGGKWRFWTPRDRTAPLREAAARGWPNKEQT